MPQKPKLLEQVRQILRRKNYSYATEKSYIHWVKRYIFFHNKKHPAELGLAEVEMFLRHLAIEGNVAATTQNQALSALLFLYAYVLNQPLGHVNVIWAKKPVRLPVVLTREEVKCVMSYLSGVPLIATQLLYGAGLRLKECLQLRVKEIDFGQNMIIVREGKGNKDRTTTLPSVAIPALKNQLKDVQQLHYDDLKRGFGRVSLPNALSRKYPNAHTELKWQFVFPSSNLSKDPRGDDTLYRHHIHPSGIQKAIKRAAAKTNINKKITPYTFRHSFATHLLESGYDIRTIQELLGHKDVKTTMIYTHVANQGVLGVRSPLDEIMA